MKKLLPLLVATLAILTVACKKNADSSPNPEPPANKIAPDGFTFKTTKDITLSVRLQAPDNKAIAGVPVNIYTRALQAGETGSPLFTAVTDANGSINTTISIPSYLDTLYVDPAYTGLMRFAKAYISGTTLTATIGGSAGYGGNVVATGNRTSIVSQHSAYKDPAKFVYMGAYDLTGRPLYLESTDAISSKLLSYINASLPEGKDLRTTHPSYLSQSVPSNLTITATADVWVTFVSEGADYRNSIGYYTYPTNKPPTDGGDIDTVRYVFPNASLYGSGGGMRSGDKVKLGRFPAGTTIGFTLLQDAWNGYAVSTSGAKFYSDPQLNPETSASLQKHSVVLNDAEDNLFVIGFEDMNRSSSSCDHDFNDVVLYATTNPVSAVSTTSMSPIDTPKDTDGDGVSDVFDQFPTDATRAYINYYPSSTTYATLAFEDSWPKVGDYDMNDLLVNYQYRFISNASNNVVELYGNFAVGAAGATFKNGFGVQFPFAASTVKQATGQKFISSYITLASNGVEAGQSKAVIIPFDNHEALITNYAGAYFINTKNELPKVTGDTAKMYVQFTSPISTSTLGTAPFNPFLISNLRRGYEVHLPGNLPTDKATTTLFGTDDDASKPSSGIYYVSKNNWPWAISFPGAFTYPLETNSISSAYLHFLDWAASNGTQYTDWYSNTSSGYRNTSNLYTK
ncbi:MAG: LruC domain-containing protein [Filimonas sp.]|nr:LruC domain-containing protein [Filimonas sp.]